MLAIVLVMAVASLSFTAEWLGQRRHDQQEVERLQTHARGLAVLASRSFRGGDFQPEALDELLHDSAAQLGVSYEVHRVRGDGELEVLASVGVHAGFEALPTPATELGSRVDDELLDRYQLLLIDEPIPTRDSQRVNLRMIAEHSPWASRHDWRETLIVAGGVGLLLLVLGGLLLELQVLRPMRALELAVARVAKGELDVEAPTDGPAELAELALAFNNMITALREHQSTLASQGERLQRSERLAAIGRLAAGVAHEVGNPLAAIVGYTELLLDEPALADDDRDLLERVQAQTQRIQAIVGQLLDYSKPAKKQTVAFSAVARAQEVVSLLRADPRCGGVALEVAGDPELEALADPGLVEQILINLVLNGARAAAEGEADEPRVRIRVRELGTELAIDVRDNGKGVPDDVRPRLFEPFFTTRGPGQGTGLGLAVSQGLAESMDGSLEHLDSADPGAVFRLRVPAQGPTR
ncbi:Sensor protein ZraS [Enhygromyxa salina]|uniref:histidine kinase n=2 Tax=Enhygromyxa salina TaxID=215803 RepID=A0A2S9YGA1_9BACT|nr:Sensor protein ZraS [Enhygromyxa salina]